MPEDTWKIPSKVATLIIGLLLSGAMSFNVWAVSSVFARTTRDDVADMIQDKSPYVSDRAMILRSIEQTSQHYVDLKRAIQRQTEAVIELQTIVKNLR